MKTTEQNKNSFFARILITFIVIILLCIFVAYQIWNYRENIEARVAFSEARNVKLALNLLSIQYYGASEDMYDDNQESGLSEAAEEDLWKLVDEKGEFVILNRQETETTPTRFMYQRGQYVVIYTAPVEETQEESWQVYRVEKVLGVG